MMSSNIILFNYLAQMVLSDGSIKTFQISVEQFSQIRYAVAKVNIEF